MKITMGRFGFKANLAEMVKESWQYKEMNVEQKDFNRFITSQSLGLDSALEGNSQPKWFQYLTLSFRLKFDKVFKDSIVSKYGIEYMDTMTGKLHNKYFEEAVLDGNSFEDALEYADTKIKCA